jgi:hypothetical protein
MATPSGFGRAAVLRRRPSWTGQLVEQQLRPTKFSVATARINPFRGCADADAMDEISGYILFLPFNFIKRIKKCAHRITVALNAANIFFQLTLF